MNDERTGRATNHDELFDQTMIIADTALNALDQGEAMRDEVARTLEKIESSFTSVMANITKLKTEFKEAYVPAEMERAVKVSESKVDDFEKRINGILEGVQLTSDKVKKGLVWQVGLAAATSAVLVAAVCWFSLQWIPSFDDIQKRQSEMAGLQKQIADFTSELKAMKSRFVSSNGQWYARYDNGPLYDVCDPNDGKSCGTYILVK